MITHQHVKSVEQQDRLVQQRRLALADRQQMEEARVVFEQRWDGTPPYRVGIHIVTPGPDLMAEGEDQTLQAAVLKSLRQLDNKVRQCRARWFGPVALKVVRARPCSLIAVKPAGAIRRGREQPAVQRGELATGDQR